jgi:hypothetical protein
MKSVKKIYKKLDFRIRLSTLNMWLGRVGLVLVIVTGDDDLPIELHLTLWSSYKFHIMSHKGFS